MKGSDCILQPNIRQGWKSWVMTNTLAYFVARSVTQKKQFSNIGAIWQCYKALIGDAVTK